MEFVETYKPVLGMTTRLFVLEKLSFLLFEISTGMQDETLRSMIFCTHHADME